MSTNGLNSILFDFDSIIDKEISIINFLMGEYQDSTSSIIDIDAAKNMNIDKFRFRRLYGNNDLFRSLLVHEAHKIHYDTIMNQLFDRDQEDIFRGNYAYKTTMPILISAYKKAGNGTIRTVIRCDNEHQQDFIRSFNRDVPVIISERKDVDMSKYGRLIVGYYKSALEYNLEQPKSIIVLNYRENFDPNNTRLLNPELIISLGDIHEIMIIPAFKEDEFING